MTAVIILHLVALLLLSLAEADNNSTTTVQRQAAALLALYDACSWPTRTWTRTALASGDASVYCAQFDGLACDATTQLVTRISLRGVNALGRVPHSLLLELSDSLTALDLQGNGNLHINATAAIAECGAGACGSKLARLDLSGGVVVELDVDAVDLLSALPGLSSFALGPAAGVVARNSTAFLNALFQLANLTELSLRTLPSLAGGSELDTTYLCSATRLRLLRLSQLRLAGFAPPLACWAQMPALRLLDLSGNLLGRDASGAVQQTPSALLCQGTPLQVVDLSDNAFAMPMCTNFTGSQLREYSVANNALRGPLPAVVDAPQLVALDVSFNDMATALPPTLLASLPPTLARLALTGNALTGVLQPADLRSAAQLGQPLALLDLTENQLRSDAVLSDVVNSGAVMVRNATSTLAGAPGVVCFQLLLANGGLLNVDAALYDFAQCQCADGFVGRAPQCQRCPALALDCSDKRIVVGAGAFPVLVVQQNLVSKPLTECLVATVGVQSCGDFAHACRGGAVDIVTRTDFVGVDVCVESDAFCSAGYSGRLCATCACDADACYYGGRDAYCHACPTAGGTATLATLAIVLLLGLAAFVASLHTLRVRAFGGPLYVVTALFFLYFLGVTALISAVWLVLIALCIALGRYANGDALMRVATFWMFATAALAPHMCTEIMHLFHIDGIVPLIECAFPSLASPLPRLAVQAAAPILLCLLPLTALLGRFCFGRNGRGGARGGGGGGGLRQPLMSTQINDNDNDLAGGGLESAPVSGTGDDIRMYQSNRDGVPTPVVAAMHARRIGGVLETTLSTVGYLVQLVHFDVCFTALSVFQCNTEPVTGALYVQRWPAMSCSSSEHSQLMLIGVAAAVVWGLALPIATAALLYYYPRHAALAQLWAPYHAAQQQFVAPYLLLRNVAFAAAITVTQGPLRVATVNALALVASAVHQKIVMHTAHTEHAIEVVVLLLVAFTTAIAENGAVDTDGELDNATLAITIVNGVFAVALLLGALLWRVLEQLWQRRRRSTLKI